MKKCSVLIVVVLLGISFSLQAQIPPNATVYVAPVSGAGSAAGDNEYFAGLITRELENHNYRIARTPRTATHTITAAISPFEIFTLKVFILHLALRDNITGEIMGSQDLIYGEPFEINSLIGGKISQILHATPTAANQETPGTDNMSEEMQKAAEAAAALAAGGTAAGNNNTDEWRTREWYFSASLYWSPRVYAAAESTSTYYTNFGFGLYIDYHFIDIAPEKKGFFKYFGIGTGLEITPEWVAASDMPDDHYRDLVLEFPIVLQAVFRPGSHFMFIPYAGINFNWAIYMATKPPLLSWKAGLQYGVKAGPGMIVINPWFSMDIGNSSLYDNENVQYKRYMMHIGLGYKIGLNPADFARQRQIASSGQAPTDPAPLP